MKYLKETSKQEKIVQEVEDFLREKGVYISIGCNGIVVKVDGKSYTIHDIENREDGLSFPRELDSEKLITEW